MYNINMKIINKTKIETIMIKKIGLSAGIDFLENSHLVIIEEELKEDNAELNCFISGGYATYQIKLNPNNKFKRSSLSHELKHIEQIQRLGFDEVERISEKFCYDTDPLEIEAFKFQSKYL
jgi:hypothetical protein